MLKVQVLKVVHRSGNKNGKDWSMDIAKCVVQGDDGEVAVGSIVLPKEHPEVKAGHYTGTLTAQDSGGDIVFRINKLLPVAAVASVKA